MGKSTNEMVMFNSFMFVYQILSHDIPLISPQYIPANPYKQMTMTWFVSISLISFPVKILKSPLPLPSGKLT